ncbi:MAG: hypothetical protein ACFFC7_13460 [Candidatus Hermodarchaeota archaeon]
MSNLQCFYHPEREAATKCEKCGKLICLECKLIRREYTLTGSDSSQWVRYEVCPACYAEMKAASARGSKVFVIIAAVMCIAFIVIAALILIFFFDILSSFPTFFF